MQTRAVQLTDVIYNAANQSFEALVTVHENGTSTSYPCAIDAPIDMSFEQAAKGLTTQALRRHKTKRGMYSASTSYVAPQRAGRPQSSALRWLENLMRRPQGRAA